MNRLGKNTAVSGAKMSQKQALSDLWEPLAPPSFPLHTPSVPPPYTLHTLPLAVLELFGVSETLRLWRHVIRLSMAI
jgi:hypothetical protein